MFNFKTFALAAACAFAISAPGSAAAQGSVALDSKVQLERVVEQDGTQARQLTDPVSVVPGDRLLFTNTYRNTGADAVDDFVITNPLPAAIELAEMPAEAVVSVDDGATYGPLASMQVAGNDGTMRAATPADVTHLRWTIAQVAPDATGIVTFYGQVR